MNQFVSLWLIKPPMPPESDGDIKFLFNDREETLVIGREEGNQNWCLKIFWNKSVI